MIKPLCAVALMCRVLDVSPSSYYTWHKRPSSQQEMANQELLKANVEPSIFPGMIFRRKFLDSLGHFSLLFSGIFFQPQFGSNIHRFWAMMFPLGLQLNRSWSDYKTTSSSREKNYFPC